MDTPLLIGALARMTGTKVTTIRFYESIGLLDTPRRTHSGRRSYAGSDLRRLHFIRNGRRLGFSTEEIRSLIALDGEPDRECAEASVIAARHLAEVEDRLAQLTALRDELALVASSCGGERTADCRIIQAIAGGSRAATTPDLPLPGQRLHTRAAS